jgi:membrane protease YdiL (CAAX protease family)
MLWAMGARESTTPQPGAARAYAVVVFYGALFLVGFFWHAIAQDRNDFWRLVPDQDWSTLAWTPLVGVLFGFLVVWGFRALEPRFAWLSELHREFRSIFGRPSMVELVLLAAASALAEEVLFRGAMLDAWGFWPSSIVFALLHIPPRRTLWPWTVSSFVLGLALAGLTLETGNLGAAVAAHFVINLKNLSYITRRQPAMFLRRADVPGDHRG